MDRRRFLVIAAAASSAGLAPRAVFAAVPQVVNVRVLRWPKEMLHGTPSRCAGMRGAGTVDIEAMYAG